MNKRKLKKKIETLMYVIEKQDQAIRLRDEQIAELTKFTHD